MIRFLVRLFITAAITMMLVFGGLLVMTNNPFGVNPDIASRAHHYEHGHHRKNGAIYHTYPR